MGELGENILKCNGIAVRLKCAMDCERRVLGPFDDLRRPSSRVYGNILPETAVLQDDVSPTSTDVGYSHPTYTVSQRINGREKPGDM